MLKPLSYQQAVVWNNTKETKHQRNSWFLKWQSSSSEELQPSQKGNSNSQSYGANEQIAILEIIIESQAINSQMPGYLPFLAISASTWAAFAA